MQTGRAIAEAGLHPLSGGDALGVDREAPVGFSAIRLAFELDADPDVDERQLAKLLELTERYCVVYQTLAGGPRLSTTLRAQQS